ncbi:hypothetical protein J3E68DRAFT_406114, partial [Trichoderma sp. SZMC 28012]
MNVHGTAYRADGSLEYICNYIINRCVAQKFMKGYRVTSMLGEGQQTHHLLYMPLGSIMAASACHLLCFSMSSCKQNSHHVVSDPGVGRGVVMNILGRGNSPMSVPIAVKNYYDDTPLTPRRLATYTLL